MSISDRLDELDALGEFLNPAESELVHGASTALRAVLAINTGDNRSVYGIDFEAGMCKALAIVHQTITAALGQLTECGSVTERES